MPSDADTTSAIHLIGYGSLMSGLGLATLSTLPVSAASPVRLHNCRRGFGKLSRFGNRYAMVLDPIRLDEPLSAAPLNQSTGGVEALAVTIALDALERVAVREGYRADVIRSLAEQAAATGLGLASFLSTLLVTSGFDCGGYRRQLYELTGFASAHYIPHPVWLTGGEFAITFLAPGPEGSGSDAVVPVRVATGVTKRLSLLEAWQRKPNQSQVEYGVMCLLAAVHGISLSDVLEGLARDSPLMDLLNARLETERPQERQRFMKLLGLRDEAYSQSFPARARDDNGERARLPMGDHAANPRSSHEEWP